jgi:16S rRNA G966 N2-methylase RsmD
VGIEALSRGAAFCRFTELNRVPLDTIKVNLETTRLAARAEAKRAEAFASLASPPDRYFHYIYIAPPQYKGMWIETLAGLDANLGWLAEDGWAIAQIHPKEYQSLELRGLQEFDRRKYGSTLLVFYQRR